MACSALEGIFKRQYALSGGHLAGRILILRTCSACPPPALDCEHQSGLAGGVNCQILPRGGCRTDSRYWRGSRYRTVPDPGLLWAPEGRPAAAGEESPVLPDERSGRRELLPSDFPPARGARVFAENWQAQEIDHGVREYLREIGRCGGSATGRARGIFGARTRCSRRGDGAEISPRTPPGDRLCARTIFGFPNAAGGSAPVRQGTAPFRERRAEEAEGEEGRSRRRKCRGPSEMRREHGLRAGSASRNSCRCRHALFSIALLDTGFWT